MKHFFVCKTSDVTGDVIAKTRNNCNCTLFCIFTVKSCDFHAELLNSSNHIRSVLLQAAEICIRPPRRRAKAILREAENRRTEITR